MSYLSFFLVSLLASTIGAIAGIGGGVIIKPVMDAFQILSVSTISFLSGCTVLSMSFYSTVRMIHSGSNRLNGRTILPLGISAAIGGIIGKDLFKQLSAVFSNPDAVGSIQSTFLMLLTVLAFFYTVYTSKIKTHSLRSLGLTCLIGLLLGILSSFLGIGGGPFNLMVLSYFFSMDIKSAAQNSLIIILLSQIASLATTLITRSLPEFPPLLLILMVAGGIIGGMIGRTLNKRMNANHIKLLYCGTMIVIILLSLKNTIFYLS